MQNKSSSDFEVVTQAIAYLEENYRSQPNLADTAAAVGLSEYHFQRVFSRWAGISPKRFIQFLTIQHAKQVLDDSQTLLDATYETGLSSPGRLHDLFVTHEAITPGQYKSGGTGIDIFYAFYPTQFGECLLAVTERGICGLSFIDDDNRAQALAHFAGSWPGANIAESKTKIRPYYDKIFNTARSKQPLNLVLKGTNFQIKVWAALLQIPPGALVSYGSVARLIGQPQAVRAVGTAVGHNPIAFLIPCHRVIRQVGVIGSYRWGAAPEKSDHRLGSGSIELAKTKKARIIS